MRSLQSIVESFLKEIKVKKIKEKLEFWSIYYREGIIGFVIGFVIGAILL